MSEKITGLPIIGDVDLCVLGGKLHTVYRALSLARQGKKVLLAVKEGCLGEDICQTFRYRLSEEECSFSRRRRVRRSWGCCGRTRKEISGGLLPGGGDNAALWDLARGLPGGGQG